MSLNVSVALCTCNGAHFLAEQVRSICEQDRPPREIVLSDDASDDDSVEVVRQTLASIAPPSRTELVVLRNERRLGVTHNFEQALRACRHELIALCDQDDRWHPGRLRRMVDEFEARPDLLLLHTDARLVDGDLRPLGLTLFGALEVRPSELDEIARGDAFRTLSRRNLVTGATTLLRRRLLDAALPFPPTAWLHDEWLAAIAAAIGRMDVLPMPLIDYRQHGRNQVGARRQTLGSKVAKAFAPREGKYDDRLRRAQALLGRLEALGGAVAPALVQIQRQKVAHQRVRATLPRGRLARIVPVLREIARGGYTRFDRGWQAVAQDLLERGGSRP